MSNAYTHFYLYAKGHYQCGDTMADLVEITKHYASVSYATPSDVLIVLMGAVTQALNHDNAIYSFREFVFNVMRSPSETTVLDSLLNILAATLVGSLNLGDPDPNILPLASTSKHLTKS